MAVMLGTPADLPRALPQRVNLFGRHLVPLAQALDPNIDAFVLEHETPRITEATAGTV